MSEEIYSISPLCQYIHDFSKDTAPSGAGDGIRGGLHRLLNDQNEEAKLLAFQLGLLKNYFDGNLKDLEY